MYDAAASKRYRERHPEKVRSIIKNWRERNKDHIREYERKRHAALSPHDRVARNAQLAKWRKENKEKYLKYLKDWREDNQDKIRVLREIDKRRRRSLIGSFTISDIERIRKLQRNRCGYCHNAMAEEHLDHIIPVVAGGTNFPANLQLLCGDCNRRKSAKDPITFAQSLGRLL